MSIKIRPALLEPDQQFYPLQTGDIEPTQRLTAFRTWLSTPLNYPHCPRCHRALMADGRCPTNDFRLPPSLPPLRWWEFWKWIPALRRD
jgi:hypothetical protein